MADYWMLLAEAHLSRTLFGSMLRMIAARRAESSTRAQTMAGRETRNGLRRHPDLPRVWVSNPIEFLTADTGEKVLGGESLRPGHPQQHSLT